MSLVNPNMFFYSINELALSQTFSKSVPYERIVCLNLLCGEKDQTEQTKKESAKPKIMFGHFTT